MKDVSKNQTEPEHDLDENNKNEAEVNAQINVLADIIIELMIKNKE